MAPRTDLSDEPNDKLLLRVLHVTALGPLYVRRAAQDALRLDSAVVYVDPEHWPPNSEQQEAIRQWSAAKCGIRPEAVTLQRAPDELVTRDPE
jgi:hypothetical protein